MTVWGRGTAPDGRHYLMFNLRDDQVERLAAGRAIMLDAERLGLPLLVVLITSHGTVQDALLETLGTLPCTVSAYGLIVDAPEGNKPEQMQANR